MNRSPVDRRRFIRMSVAAAGAGVVAAAGAAEIGGGDAVTTPAPAKPTYLVIYRPGPAWKAGTPIRELPLRDHGRYMLELFKRGTLRFAGRFDDDSGGAVMFDAENDADARTLVEADPAVSSQIFTFQLHRWAIVPWAEIAKRQTSPSK